MDTIGKNRDRNYKHRKKKLDYINAYKDRPCMLCGIRYPYYVMELHHRDPEEKSEHINLIVRNFGWDMLIEEIVKCDVLCANCHRRVEYGGAVY